MNSRFVDALVAEIAEEQAGTLGRAGAALEHALRELRSFEPPVDAPLHVRLDRRARLVAQAAHATLSFVVQREAGGLRDHAHVFEHYEVPTEVMAQMGKRVPPP